MEGPCADSEEKHEPVSGVDIAVAVSQKVLDLDGRLEKRTSLRLSFVRPHCSVHALFRRRRCELAAAPTHQRPALEFFTA